MKSVVPPIEIPTASPIALPEVELPPAVGIAFDEGSGEEPESADAGNVLGIVICVGDVGIAFDEGIVEELEAVDAGTVVGNCADELIVTSGTVA